MDGTISWMIRGADRDLRPDERLQRWHRRALDEADAERSAGRAPWLALPTWLRQPAAASSTTTTACCAA